ncbi:hypothetical protein TNIN_194791 [Trichonephila inaurata madagascariensis]|uniref:Uncharacterized protein n=1 Tax=Trichonephila inaurata madagascariensis TaxID=2747483 RepID=A0A8X7C1H5_9ARAC|nr:hypothetical protein TNIN_194791 [Trichonephila inaurata madagascariensis]
MESLFLSGTFLSPPGCVEMLFWGMNRMQNCWGGGLEKFVFMERSDRWRRGLRIVWYQVSRPCLIGSELRRKLEGVRNLANGSVEGFNCIWREAYREVVGDGVVRACRRA